ncbi:uncharacterized protein PAC_12898 [Phialocephala subalpina]|uniref:DUF218 domain-containing protein n=1 Tax=Phialocephala subalpina TaxID=576137 RepID=A0A1L7XDA3_9HELO|nr:uncharacterized protein PAC_12898 [Phialocephala subalpina]
MVSTPSIKEVEKYFETEFRPICQDIIADKTNPCEMPKKWQAGLHWLIRSRFDKVDLRKQTWDAIAYLLCITDDEAYLMLHRYPSCRRGEKRKLLITSVNKANYLINIFLGRITTNRYIDLERPSFDQDGAAYADFLFASINELLNSDVNKAILALQESENKPFMERTHTLVTHDRDAQCWRDKYEFILVLGTSPLVHAEKLSQASIAKADESLAFSSPRFSTNFIACGGPTRPFGTTIVEAYELKQHLMLKGEVPEDKILIDATSEHTFTNIWNAALLAFNAAFGGVRKLALGDDLLIDSWGHTDEANDRAARHRRIFDILSWFKDLEQVTLVTQCEDDYEDEGDHEEYDDFSNLALMDGELDQNPAVEYWLEAGSSEALKVLKKTCRSSSASG